jgi:hypothetical protein
MEDSGVCSVSASEKISPENASALWKERLASLFVWPAIMSNIAPKFMDPLFQNDSLPSTSSSHGNGGSEGNTGVSKLKTSIKTKKRKRTAKSKDVAKKKRKYVKSGKYKKPYENVECVQRRSTRHVVDPTSESLNMEVDDVAV